MRGYFFLAVLSSVALSSYGAIPRSGKFWYEQHCASCHGSPAQERQTGTPKITGFSAARIRYALAKVSATLNVGLSERQIVDVELYLSPPADFASAPSIDYTHLWWSSAESGWGLSLTQHSNSNLVRFLYLYPSDGEQLWLITSEMRWQAATRVTRKLLQTRAVWIAKQWLCCGSHATAQRWNNQPAIF